MKIAVLVPDTPHWKGPARGELYRSALEPEHEAVMIPVLRKPPMVDGFDIVFNHALQVGSDEIVRLAIANPQVKFVNVNHSPLATFDERPRFVAKMSDAIVAADDRDNVWYAAVEPTKLVTLCNRWLHLPMPVQKLHPRKLKNPGEVFRVFMCGRCTTQKNMLNQLVGFALFSRMCDAELVLCMDEPEWLDRFLSALGARFTHYGRMPWADYIETISQEADAIMQCSLSESINVVACEAMQLGIPVVCTKSVWMGDEELTISDPSRTDEMAAKLFEVSDSAAYYSDRAVKLGSEIVEKLRRGYLASIETIANCG